MLNHTEKIALTPPMGWNSWNCYGATITQEKIMIQADAMVKNGLKNYGFKYINIDDGWQGERGGQYNAIQGNSKFPDIKALCGYVHNLGLKIGIYSTPWEKSYAGYTGGAKHEYEDAMQWADWGIDFLKYDWNMSDENEPSEEYIVRMRNALDATGRKIIFSLSNSAPLSKALICSKYTNMWRTTGDIIDTWESVSGIGFYQDRWKQYAGPGHWNDPDMMVLGHVGWGENQHPSRLNYEEQITHFTLWCILAAPLILGCDLTKLDDPLLRILTNREVISVNQDSLGIQGYRLKQENNLEIWEKPLQNGKQVVAIFNIGNSIKETIIYLKDIGISKKVRLKDLWIGKYLGNTEDYIKVRLNPHGVMIVKTELI